MVVAVAVVVAVAQVTGSGWLRSTSCPTSSRVLDLRAGVKSVNMSDHPSDEDVLRWLQEQAATAEPEEPTPHAEPRPEDSAGPLPSLEDLPVGEPRPWDSAVDIIRREVEATVLPWYRPPDPSYDLWVPLIAGPLEPGRALRGEQVDTWNLASICTGTSPEDRTAGLFGTDHRLIFSCDPKTWSLKFMQENNFRKPEVHFIDLRDLQRGRTAHTAPDGDEVNFLDYIATLVIDVLLAGISCKPNSFARQNRSRDIWSHPDTWMMPAFLDVLLATGARDGVLENVDGFLKTDQQSGISPIYWLLKLAHDKGALDLYTVVLFKMDGSLFHSWDRNRVWLLFHKKTAGEASQDMIIKMILDFARSSYQLTVLGDWF